MIWQLKHETRGFNVYKECLDRMSTQRQTGVSDIMTVQWRRGRSVGSAVWPVKRNATFDDRTIVRAAACGVVAELQCENGGRVIAAGMQTPDGYFFCYRTGVWPAGSVGLTQECDGRRHYGRRVMCGRVVVGTADRVRWTRGTGVLV